MSCLSKDVTTVVLFALLVSGCGEVVEPPVEVEPNLVVTPAAVVLTATEAQAGFQIKNAGGEGPLTWRCEVDQEWLSVEPVTGEGAQNVMVHVNRSHMTPGVGNGNVTIQSNGGQRTVVPVSVHVQGTLLVLPSTIDYGCDRSVRTLRISNPLSGEVAWEVEADVSWLTLDPATGSGEAEVNVLVVSEALNDATDLTATITVKSLDPGIDPVLVPVTLESGIVFRGLNLPHPRAVYINGNRVSTLPSGSQETVVSLEPGSYSYHFVDEDCQLRTDARSVEVPRDRCARVFVTSTSPPFQTPTVRELRASEGSREDRVDLSWDGVSPSARYELWRHNGDWDRVGTFEAQSYRDSNVDPVTNYFYSVRPVWSCATGEFTRNAHGYAKSAAFHSTSGFPNDPEQEVTLTTKLDIWGMQGQSKAVVSYWKKGGDWSCNNCNSAGEQPPDCRGNCSRGVLAIVDRLNSPYPQTVWTLTHTYPYSCFSDRTGRYCGEFQLYRGSSMDCSGGGYDRSRPICYTWSRSSIWAGTPARAEFDDEHDLDSDDPLLTESLESQLEWAGSDTRRILIGGREFIAVREEVVPQAPSGPPTLD